MQGAVAAILEGMPDPVDLHVHEHGGEVAVMAGSRVLACYPAGDAVMRNMTAVVLTGLGFAGKDVAAALGLTAVYVSMLRTRARGEGSAGLARRRGRPAMLGAGALVPGGGDGGRGDRPPAGGARDHGRPLAGPAPACGGAAVRRARRRAAAGAGGRA